MNAVISVQAYQAKHKEQVISLILKIQRDEFDIPITRKDQPDICSIESFYQIENGNFFVALHEDNVVGTIGLLNIGRHQGALRKMFVKKEFRGKVYNTSHMLLHKLLQWSHSKGFKKIYIGTTPLFLAAHSFYEKNGFQVIGPEQLPGSFPVMKVDKKFYQLVLQ
ncbi:MAG: GNAT family acetyltransferase [Peptococcaceae bacterium BICA1-7]|nr:MAG: GNAT family acetyltransferase [Peptococcaceae bacterium BICA1-7]HBV96362.1 N-acetyltransferase [Desulfotomaculum sp.]